MKIKERVGLSVNKISSCSSFVYRSRSTSMNSKSAMTAVITIIFIIFVLHYSSVEAIYSNISENVIKNDWTELDGVWGSLLEEWTLGNNRLVYFNYTKLGNHFFISVFIDILTRILVIF